MLTFKQLCGVWDFQIKDAQLSTTLGLNGEVTGHLHCSLTKAASGREREVNSAPKSGYNPALQGVMKVGDQDSWSPCGGRQGPRGLNVRTRAVQ